MKGFSYVAAAVIVVVGVTVGGIALVGAWSPQPDASPSYASPAAVLHQVGCTGQDIQPAGDAAYCPPQASLGPLSMEAMTFSRGALPTAYLLDHPAEFANGGASVVYGPNWFLAMWSTFGSSLVERALRETGGILWETGDYGSTPVCQAVPRLDLLVIRQTDDNPQLHLRFPFPSTVTVSKPSLVQAVAKALCGLPTVKPGVYHCPADIGLDYNLSFSTKAQYFSLLSVPATGCQWVDGLGSTRSVTSSFWHTLGKAMGLAKPSYASFSGNRGYG